MIISYVIVAMNIFKTSNKTRHKNNSKIIEISKLYFKSVPMNFMCINKFIFKNHLKFFEPLSGDRKI